MSGQEAVRFTTDGRENERQICGVDIAIGDDRALGEAGKSRGDTGLAGTTLATENNKFFHCSMPITARGGQLLIDLAPKVSEPGLIFRQYTGDHFSLRVRFRNPAIVRYLAEQGDRFLGAVAMHAVVAGPIAVDDYAKWQLEGSCQGNCKC